MRNSMFESAVADQPERTRDVLMQLWQDVEQTLAVATSGPQELPEVPVEAAPVRPRRTERATSARVRFAFD